MTFEQWCKELKRQLLFYGVGGGQVLSPTELRQVYDHGMSIYSAYDISTDVANGFSFEQAFASSRGLRIS